jgi:hypothetical protein
MRGRCPARRNASDATAYSRSVTCHVVFTVSFVSLHTSSGYGDDLAALAQRSTGPPEPRRPRRGSSLRRAGPAGTSTPASRGGSERSALGSVAALGPDSAGAPDVVSGAVPDLAQVVVERREVAGLGRCVTNDVADRVDAREW